MKKALISVFDKTNLIPFAQGLSDNGYSIISTGGTKRALDEAGIKTISVDEVTLFPEMMDGRVKTLHPMIHGGLLAVRDNEQHVAQMKEHHIEAIDLVCVNLYPFKAVTAKADCTLELAIENIDIGGPSMIRSASKNHRFVTVVTDPSDYSTILQEIKDNGDTTLETRQHLAMKAFNTTADYDKMIYNYLSKTFNSEESGLRYGENPHQKATFVKLKDNISYSLVNAKQLHGKELSYNNIQDGNATLEILKEFPETPCVVAVKHANPCGVGIGDTIYDAWKKAYESDTTSIFGGIVAFNREVDTDCAKELSSIFLEIILAPSFTEEAFSILSQKKNIRLLTFSLEGEEEVEKEVWVRGGKLIQDIDVSDETVESIQCVTTTLPVESDIDDALFGMKVVKHVKSNAIVIVKNGQTIGVGAGQMNRVGSAKIALEQAGDKAKGAVMASDAFFPMNDTVLLAAQFGIRCIIQPGGSIRDQESIDECNNQNIAMIFTGKRHFKH